MNKRVEVDPLLGHVSGASSNLYAGPGGTVTVNFSAPLAAVVGHSGGYEHENFQRQNWTIFGGEIRFFGSGEELSLESRAAGGAELTFGLSAVLGGAITVSLPSFAPSSWEVSSNGFVSLDLALSGGALGMGVGAGVGTRYDGGTLSSGAFVDLGLMGLSASFRLDPDNGPVASYAPPSIAGLQAATATRILGAEASVRPDIPRSAEITQAIELAKSYANSMKPSAKKVAADPGGFGLGPGSQYGGNSLPSGRADRDQQGGGTSGSSGISGSSGRSDRDQQGGGRSAGTSSAAKTPSASPSKATPTVNTPAGPKQVDPKSTFGSSNAKHYDQVSKGKVKSGLPVALDLDGDGLEVSFFTNTAFDLDGDGYRERTAWVAPDDALLVIDLNADGTRGAGDGKIDQTKEVVLAAWSAAGATDLQALAEARDEVGNLIFDTNGDGQLTAADASFAEFRVWQDKDQDGIVDEGELTTLSEAGITQIGLRYDNGSPFTETSENRSVRQAGAKNVAPFVKSGRAIAVSLESLGLWKPTPVCAHTLVGLL